MSDAISSFILTPHVYCPAVMRLPCDVLQRVLSVAFSVSSFPRTLFRGVFSVIVFKKRFHGVFSIIISVFCGSSNVFYFSPRSSRKQSGIGQYSVSETAQVGNPSCAVILKSCDINVRGPREHFFVFRRQRHPQQVNPLT